VRQCGKCIPCHRNGATLGICIFVPQAPTHCLSNYVPISISIKYLIASRMCWMAIAMVPRYPVPDTLPFDLWFFSLAWVLPVYRLSDYLSFPIMSLLLLWCPIMQHFSPLLRSSPWFGVGLKYKWNTIASSVMHEGRLEAGLAKHGKQSRYLGLINQGLISFSFKSSATLSIAKPKIM